jgi:hypothetical protein
MFEVKHRITTYEHWRAFKEWNRDYNHGRNFGEYIMCNYPECIKTSLHPAGRIFKFNSGADYTFFLLRVS